MATVLDLTRVEAYVVVTPQSWTGRPPIDVRFLARAFVAKAYYDLPTTECLREMLKTDVNLRHLCGFRHRSDVPSSATFSRAFAQFAKDGLGDLVQRAMVSVVFASCQEAKSVNVSRDATEVTAREKATRQTRQAAKSKAKGDNKGPWAKEPNRLEEQLRQAPEYALNCLPKCCDFGTKMDTNGYKHTWKGYKVHIDWATGGLPINVVTTSASVHDSQVAIPMARQTAQRVSSMYDLMDSAYDAKLIRDTCTALGHVPVIDPNMRRYGISTDRKLDQNYALIYKERTTAERGNARLKDEFGLRHLRVRGHAKVHLHIMFGVITLFADQILKSLALTA